MKTEEFDKLKEKVKNQIGKTQTSGFKLLTHYYPKDAIEQIDDIFKIIESEISEKLYVKKRDS